MNEDLEVTLDDIPVDIGWRLARWFLEAGATDFTFACISARSTEPAFCRAADLALSAYRVPNADEFSRGRAPAPPAKRWLLNEASLEVLRTLLPDGLLTDRQGAATGWIEDLTICQSGRDRLRVNTHEHFVALYVSEVELQQLRDANLID